MSFAIVNGNALVDFITARAPLFVALYQYNCYYIPMSLVDWLHAILTNYPLLKYLVVFLGTALGGEFFLLTFAFLSAQGLVSLSALVPLAFLGTYCADTTWFLLGRSHMLGKVFEHKYASPTISVVTKTIHRMSRGSHFMALVFAKFLFGTRIITIIYVSKTYISFKKFLHFNIYAVLLWVAIVIPIGYASGLGYTYVSHVFENIYASITFIVLMIAGITMLQFCIKKMFKKEEEITVEKE